MSEQTGMETEPTPPASAEVVSVAPGEIIHMTREALKERVDFVSDVCKTVLKKDVHFGSIPGVPKPFLLKPGAEVLCTAFNLRARLVAKLTELADGHREYEVTCILETPNGTFAGQGTGLCSTMELKYRYRAAKRKCPECGAETIIASKEEYGGGFFCWKKQGGCGRKFAENDPAIINQQLGKAENPDIADVYNTVLKMAEKRAHVDAVLRTTGASEQFTQDEETVQDQSPAAAAGGGKPPKEKKPPKAKAGAKSKESPPAGAGRTEGKATPEQIQRIKFLMTERTVEEETWTRWLDNITKLETFTAEQMARYIAKIEGCPVRRDRPEGGEKRPPEENPGNQDTGPAV